MPLIPWAPGTRDQFITITTELVEGVRVTRPPAASSRRDLARPGGAER